LLCNPPDILTSQPQLLLNAGRQLSRHRQISGSVTMTTEVGTNGATTLSRMNLSGYVGHVNICR